MLARVVRQTEEAAHRRRDRARFRRGPRAHADLRALVDGVPDYVAVLAQIRSRSASAVDNRASCQEPRPTTRSTARHDALASPAGGAASRAPTRRSSGGCCWWSRRRVRRGSAIARIAVAIPTRPVVQDGLRVADRHARGHRAAAPPGVGRRSVRDRRPRHQAGGADHQRSARRSPTVARCTGGSRSDRGRREIARLGSTLNEMIERLGAVVRRAAPVHRRREPRAEDAAHRAARRRGTGDDRECAARDQLRGARGGAAGNHAHGRPRGEPAHARARGRGPFRPASRTGGRSRRSCAMCSRPR